MKISFSKICMVLLVVLSISFLVSIVLIGLSTWGMADDFSLAGSIRKLGVLEHIVHMYNTWDGRFISIGVVQSIFIATLPIPVINAIWGTCLIGSAFFLYKLFKLNINLSKRKILFVYKVTIVALFSIILWYGMKSHVAETVYWATGGVYIFSFFVSLAWLYVMLNNKMFIIKYSKFKTFIFGLFTVFVGALSFNLSCSILAFLFIEILQLLLNKDVIGKNKKIRYLVWILLLISLGTVLILVAPGNSRRASFGERSFLFTLQSIFSNFLNVFQYYFQLSIPLFKVILVTIPLVVIIIANVLSLGIPKIIRISIPEEIRLDISNCFKRLINKNNIILILKLFQYPICAIASILPFTLIPDFVSARTSIYFMEFLILWLLTNITPKIINYISSIKSIAPQFKLNFLLPFIIIFILIFQYQIFTHIISLNKTKVIVDRREKYIQTFSNNDTDVVVGRMIKNLPFSFNFNDIAEDATNWINVDAAIYYKVKSIKTDNTYFK